MLIDKPHRWFRSWTYAPQESVLRPATRPVPTQAHRCFRDDYLIRLGMPTLLSLGYADGGSIVNLDPSVVDKMPAGQLCWTEPPLTPMDLVYAAGRLPMDDPPLASDEDDGGGPKRYTPRSGIELERQIFESVRPLIRYCDRECTIVGVDLPEDAKRYEQVIFKETKGGRTKRMGPHAAPSRAPRDPRLTVAYAGVVPSVAPIGFRLLFAWGAGGNETLVLGQLLSTRWSDLFRDLVLSDQARLVLATFRVPETVPYPFLEYDLDELDPKVVADVTMGPDAMAM